MTTHTRRLGFCTGLMLCATASALAVPVTFQVNLEYQIALGAFLPDVGTVTARGSFNSWGNSFVLTNSPANTNLYRGTVDIAGSASTIVEYKFVFNNNDGGGDKWESVTVGNRYFTLGSAAQTLPLAYYSDTWGGGPPVSITYQVNMAPQIAAGNFDPATGMVEIRGAFNSWSAGFTLTNDPARPGVYSGTFEDVLRPPGTQVEYKCVYVDGSGSVHWESIVGYQHGNRSFTMTDANQTLPVFYYGDTSGTPIKAAIYYQVDLNAQILNGNFDSTNDQVWVRGNVLGWGSPPEGFQLFEDAARPGIYTNLYTIASQLTGSTIEYKFTLWKSGTTTVWEDGDNKTATFTGLEPTNSAGYHVLTVGPTYFNNVSPSDFLPAETLVTFRVNMSGAVTYTDHTPFNAGGGDVVIINGEFLPNGWNTYGSWGTTPAETLMYDDGTHGDAVAGDLVYSWQYLAKKGAKVRVEYKFGINGADNEAASGQNHVRYVRTTGAYVMPIDLFGTQTQEDSFGNLTISRASATSVLISWLGRPGVRLQSTTALGGAWTDYPATDGLSATNFPISAKQVFYRLVK